MTKSHFMNTGALGALAIALIMTALPAQAEGGRHSGNHAARAERSMRGGNDGGNRGWSARRSAAPSAGRSERSDNGNAGFRGRSVQTDARPEGPSAARNTSYTAQRDRSYGMAARNGNWQGQRQAAQPAPQSPSAAAQARSYGSRSSGWDRNRDGRGDDARRADWQRNRDGRGDDARRADWQRDRSRDARQAERRDDRRNYANGYRDGRRDDNRWGDNHRRWDNRGWRNDNRYDWHRYRAANRSLFSLGRYYSPYRGYSYSRLSIGFRLGSLFYSNRYWINDPWQYRLPPVYGGYRWVRYYDDALLVDTYSGEVVDVIYDFFW